MEWYFIDNFTLTEKNTNFTIRLLSGSWGYPESISPDSINLPAATQAKLIRLGLDFASNADLEKRTYESPLADCSLSS